MSTFQSEPLGSLREKCLCLDALLLSSGHHSYKATKHRTEIYYSDFFSLIQRETRGQWNKLEEVNYEKEEGLIAQTPSS